MEDPTTKMSDVNPRYTKFFKPATSPAELRSYEQHQQLIASLPSKGAYPVVHNLHGFWYSAPFVHAILSAREQFAALPGDVFLATFPKCGTTWIKALAFAVLHRRTFPPSSPEHPLLKTHAQDSVLYFDEAFLGPRVPDFSCLPSPRMFNSHVAYSLLPDSVKDVAKIVYVSRDPKDALISAWHFVNDILPPGAPPMSLESMSDAFVEGWSHYGPVWDHQMEYRRESMRRPERVLYLEYGDMKANPEESVRRLAAFVGEAFTEEEEAAGAVGEIVRLCSIEFLREVEANKKGVSFAGNGFVVKKSSFFRGGRVGDWKEHLTAEMAARIDAKTQKKLIEYGLV